MYWTECYVYYLCLLESRHLLVVKSPLFLRLGLSDGERALALDTFARQNAQHLPSTCRTAGRYATTAALYLLLTLYDGTHDRPTYYRPVV